MAGQRNKKSHKADLVRLDGALCLTFVNAATARRRSITDYAGLLDWAQRSRSLTDPALADRLAGQAHERPADAAATFAEARELQALLSRILNAQADKERVPRDALEAFNARFVEILPPRRLVQAAHGCRRVWSGRADDLRRPLWGVVSSAAEVLTSDAYGRIARCAAEGCDVLFVAHNPGSARRWCAMKPCGNRVKARRPYQTKVKPMRLWTAWNHQAVIGALASAGCGRKPRRKRVFPSRQMSCLH